MTTPKLMSFVALLGLPCLLLLGETGLLLYGLTALALVLACITRDVLTGRSP